MTFKCPPDFELGEAYALTRSVAVLYNKLENLTEERYRRRTLDELPVPYPSEPKERLTIKELRYGSDFVLILLTAALVGLNIPVFLDSLQRMKERDENKTRRRRRREFRHLLLEYEGDALKSAIGSYAEGLQVSIDQLLEIVGPELEELYAMRGKFVPQNLPYK